MINGHVITKVFDHEPKEKEILVAMAAEIENVAPKTAFVSCAKKCIERKDSVLSPGTIKNYYDYIDAVIPKWFLNLKMNEIFTEIPAFVKKQAKMVFDLAMLQPSFIDAVHMLDNYTNSCVNPEEKEFCDFYFNMRMEQLKNESNPDIG